MRSITSMCTSGNEARNGAIHAFASAASAGAKSASITSSLPSLNTSSTSRRTTALFRSDMLSSR